VALVNVPKRRDELVMHSLYAKSIRRNLPDIALG
jgi:hypothetical protein